MLPSIREYNFLFITVLSRYLNYHVFEDLFVVPGTILTCVLMTTCRYNQFYLRLFLLLSY